MARPTKDSTPVNIKMDTEVYQMLEKYSIEAGMTKTIVIERAVKEYVEKHSLTNK